MNLEDLFIDVAAGEERCSGVGYRSRTIAFRESRRITATQKFDIECLRSEAHNALDIALDDLAEKIKTIKGSV